MLFVICRDRSVGKPPDCVFKKMLSSTSLKWELVVRAVRDAMVTADRRESGCERGGRAAILVQYESIFIEIALLPLRLCS